MLDAAAALVVELPVALLFDVADPPMTVNDIELADRVICDSVEDDVVDELFNIDETLELAIVLWPVYET